MATFQPFDILNSPLEGVNLVEASAGTGKTHTITGLFLRLLLERRLSIQQILVVTFTEAATAELRDRIRRRLRETLETFARGSGQDPFIEELVKRHEKDSWALIHLREALRDFDKAAIFTIHGFCMRVLQEHAFESGSLFDTELVTDQEELKRDIVEDFWRTRFYTASPLFVSYALKKGFTPDSLLALLSTRVTLPYLKVLPETDFSDALQGEETFRETFNRAKTLWVSAKGEVGDILLNDGGLNRNKYRKATVLLWLDLMDTWFLSGPDASSFKGFEKFTTAELAGSLKQGHSTPKHPFFVACDQLGAARSALEQAFDKHLLALKAELFSFVRKELGSRKAGMNIQFFDDLLTGLERALEGEGGERLSRSLRITFRAALIDEFQDTDPVQYAIFKRAFGTAGNGLFLIGDPKQAIYGFRGADVFTYLEASGDARSRYTLGENWRSAPDLVRAVNTLFENRDRPFVFEGIPFQPVKPADRKAPENFTMDRRREAPLQLWFLDAGRIGESGKVISKTVARQWIPGAVAAEISRLLRQGGKGRALIGESPLKEGDIAVLVRKNREALLIQRALFALGIPSVLHAGGNLFDSHEAEEVERVLAAIAFPNNDGLLRAALATDMLGVRGETLVRMEEGEGPWEPWLVGFRECHEVWKARGFIPMFRHLMTQWEVSSRLMAFEDGERRNTNIRHLSEVLHHASVEHKLNMTGLLKWLSAQRDGNRAGREEHPLRLESDESAVKLVTTHKSKGLEYPVVFCPFLWDGSTIRKRTQPFTFHDPADRMRLTLDLGSESVAQNRMAAEKEILAENLRILYVALTRARCRCYLVWGRFNEAETSAPAYLFYPPQGAEKEDPVEALRAHFGKLDEEALKEGLEELTGKAKGAIELLDMPLYPGVDSITLKRPQAPPLTFRKFSGRIEKGWGITSFSSLTSDHVQGEEFADRDPREPSEEEGQECAGDIFHFPRGTRSGTFFHDIFEHLDFSKSNPGAIRDLVLSRLESYGFDPLWEGCVTAMIQRVLHLPLGSERRPFRLSDLEPRDRLNELEFHFPLKPLSPDKLRDLFNQWGAGDIPEAFPETLGRLHFAPVKGFMKGFMDLVFQHEGRFFLIDWKSNVLGNRVEDYGPAGLAPAMEEGYYTLQYLIYTLALNQYLQLRLPGYDYGKHFGGVFYLFIRGVDPEMGSEYGVFRARPSFELIEAMRRQLIGE